MQSNEYQPMFDQEDAHWWFVGKRHFAQSLLSRIDLGKKTKILDLGCGTGGMTKFLEKFGQVTGVEKNRHAVRLCKKRGLKVIEGSANKVPIRSGKRKDHLFDLITIFDVLYHRQVDEDAVLSEANRLLKTKGYLLVTDCALPFFWSVHDENMMAKKRFRKSELEQLLIKHGFTPIKSSYIYFFTFPLFAFQRLYLKIFQPKQVATVGQVNWFVNQFLKYLLEFESLVLRWIPSYPVGSSIIILAQKGQPHVASG